MKIFILFILLLLSSSSYASSSPIYKVVVVKDWKPYYYVDDNGNIEGYAIDLFEQIASNIGLKYEYVVVDSWKDANRLLEEGKVDIVPNMGISEKRSKYIIFTQSTDFFEIGLFKHSNLNGLNCIKDIKEKRVGVVLKNVCVDLIDENIADTKVLYQSYHHALASLMENEIDVLCYPKNLVNYSIKELNIKNVECFGEPIKVVKRAIGVIKTREYLLEIFDKEILRIKGNGELQVIQNKWFGTHKDIEIDYKQFMWLVFLFVIFVMSFFYYVRHKKWLLTKKELELKVKEQTKDLEKSKFFLQSIIDGIDDIVFYKDENLLYLGCNRAFGEFVGYTKDEVASKNGYELFCKDSAKTLEALSIKVLNTGEKITTTIWICDSFDKKFLYSISMTPFEYKSSKLGILIVGRDITELDRLKDSELKQQKMILTQSKIAAVGEILGNIAHQWRQPLSVITTNVMLLKADIDLGEEITKETINECADDVLYQAKYLSKTIEDFREFFISSSDIVQKHSLKTILEKLENLMVASFRSNFIEYHIQKDVDFTIDTNESLVIQAFVNICNNSKDAMKEGVEDTDQRYFFIDVDKKENSIVVSFKDSGGGIREDVIDSIFEPYFTTKHKSVGTGIGLYMTHQIITKHLKGAIYVKNVEYNYDGKDLKGALFEVEIPIV
ncbi:MAG: transporter substrate-binding domain-containing protein [Campylobacterales bacterium]|nr:transporter substrate-binding domain-containing protein [Campylobacterales bacterium]